MSAVDLLPCPFCGGTNIDPKFSYAHQADGSKAYAPGCMTCGASGESPEAWNRRAPVIAEAVPVKPLVWKWDRTAWSADGGGVCYRVAEVHGEWMWFESSHKWDEELSIRKGRSASCNTAKGKAQKLHEARVRSLIGGA